MRNRIYTEFLLNQLHASECRQILREKTGKPVGVSMTKEESIPMILAHQKAMGKLSRPDRLNRAAAIEMDLEDHLDSLTFKHLDDQMSHPVVQITRVDDGKILGYVVFEISTDNRLNLDVISTIELPE